MGILPKKISRTEFWFKSLSMINQLFFSDLLLQPLASFQLVVPAEVVAVPVLSLAAVSAVAACAIRCLVSKGG